MNDRTNVAPPGHTPTFALTFDTELIWGSFDHTPPDRFEQAYPDVRGTIDDILVLLDRYEIAATWAVVGHLFLDACRRDENGTAHAEIVRPQQSHWPGDWYSADPCTDIERDPLWYGTDVLDAIGAARVPHEIACHSFGHAVYGDPAFTREAADADLAACIEIARARGLELRSFVFPRNIEAHHEALREHGMCAYRGGDGAPGERLPRPLRRVRHYAEQFIGTPPPVAPPTELLPGLWNIPASMLLIHRSGARRFISRKARARRSHAGLERARASGGVFHLWTHPFNLASDAPFLLGVLEDAVSEAARLRDQGLIVIETMAAIGERMAAGEASQARQARQAPVG